MNRKISAVMALIVALMLVCMPALSETETEPESNIIPIREGIQATDGEQAAAEDF